MSESLIGTQGMNPLIISRRNDEPERGFVAAMCRTEVKTSFNEICFDFTLSDIDF